MRRIFAAIAVSVVAFALTACGGADEEDLAATGTVLEVQDAGDPVVFTLNTEPSNNLNGAIISVAAKDLKGATPADLARGDNVKVWAQICTASIPAQCQATSVEVVDK